jgi:hypothetical protein
MEAIVAGAAAGGPTTIRDRAERPPVLTEEEAARLFVR